MITLFPEQQEAVDKITNWYQNCIEKDKEHKTESLIFREFKLGGFAGTGKTTVINSIRERIKNTSVCAFTGKAVSILRKKGNPDAKTIHSLIYTPQIIKGKVVFTLRDHLDLTQLIIVDEASMVSGELLRDLLSFDLPILWVGDPGQLEPVGDDVFLMRTPDITLQTIHRQDEGSGILKFATFTRQKGTPRAFLENIEGLRVEKISLFREDIIADQIICGFNKTRVKINAQVRKVLKYDTSPLNPGEKLICLRNNSDVGVFNGQQFVLLDWKKINDKILKVTVVDDLDVRQTFHCLASQFGHTGTIEAHILNAEKKLSGLDDLCLLDYSYCITAHKSQGSEWDSVAVIEELWPAKWESSRWRYTAITRAAKKLLYLC